MISDPCNEDTDQDNLPDGEEYEYKYFEGVTVGNLGLLIYTSPVCIDTDGDGMNDYYDDYPAEYNAPGTVYNRQAVVEYAHKWTDGTNKIFNPDFYHYPSDNGDCTNFASQCLNAGGYAMNDEWFNEKRYYSSVYIRKAYLAMFKQIHIDNDWAWTESFMEVNAFHDMLIDNDIAIEIIWKQTESPYNNLLKENIKEGDIIMFGDSLGHAAVISKIDDSDIYYCGHTLFREDEPLSLHVGETIHILHISNNIGA